MGVKRSLQSGGVLLGFLANILTILSTATNYWIRFPGGHSGLWQECKGGICPNIPCQTVLAATGACMVLAAGSSLVGLVMGLRILCHDSDLRGQTTSVIFFLCGLLLLIALTGYTVKNAWKNDVFFSWSYFSGWLALPFSIIAGTPQHTSETPWSLKPQGPFRPSAPRPSHCLPPGLRLPPSRLLLSDG
ncbi:claudin domain-containing protein 2 isoform X6 [Pteropus medius]|uniref:claudin domain-containing protein 2 n=1 Tax=Pteropus vampyrus TaxID=132908 RepID=UPI00196B10C6|nr:claudin domain-containing protein 2 [Pteropus giganteus]XP_039695534.1 claudin domain-containing protein 2 [Pteropus giganteus]